MLKGNKGEWSELYALLKILCDKRIHSGNEYLDKIDSFYEVIKVILGDAPKSNAEAKSHIFTYAANDIINVTKGDFSLNLELETIRRCLENLKRELLTNKKRDSSFSIPGIQEFLDEIKLESLKAKSSSKRDITIKIHDHRSNSEPELGFSIKSQLGSASTLLNASRATNITYKIDGHHILEEDINKYNQHRLIKEKIDPWKDNLRFVMMENETFQNNLVLIDSALPDIVAELVRAYYTTDLSKVSDLTELISKQNPLKYRTSQGHKFYHHKIKKMLSDIALGMVPSKVWNGTLDATGGYVIVKSDGEVICYHIYDKNSFDDYLFHNTKFDTASTNRHGFGDIYNEDGSIHVKLNLQIRFIK